MQRDSFSILDFCFSVGISKAFFYKLLKQGKAPKIMKIGRRTLISVEAAKEWRSKIEQSSGGDKNA